MRVLYWFQMGGEKGSVNDQVKQYAIFITAMNAIEMINWGVGMMCLDENSAWRPWVFLIGILLNLRLPLGFMPNDFHGEKCDIFNMLVLCLQHRIFYVDGGTLKSCIPRTQPFIPVTFFFFSCMLQAGSSLHSSPWIQPPKYC